MFQPNKEGKMDERQAHDAIEEAAEPYIEAGFEPVDTEPGEWLLLKRGDDEIEIRASADGVAVLGNDQERGAA
jgi:hypothetical protein